MHRQSGEMYGVGLEVHHSLRQAKESKHTREKERAGKGT